MSLFIAGISYLVQEFRDLKIKKRTCPVLDPINPRELTKISQKPFAKLVKKYSGRITP
jgi:hypothetical protein